MKWFNTNNHRCNLQRSTKGRTTTKYKPNLMTKQLLFFLLVIFFFSCKKENNNTLANPPTIEYSFFIAGHTYGKPGIDNIGFHPPFKNKFDYLKNDSTLQFGVLTGDIVLEGTEKNWDEIDTDIINLEMPVHFAVGNHDMSDRSLFETRYGNTYFSFTKNDDLFIILDPNLEEWNIGGTQLDFLKNELNIHSNNVNNIFVFFHQLLWWSSDNIYQNIVLNSIAGRAENINFWTEVEPLFNQLENKVVMCAGDVGAHHSGDEFMYHSYDNITFIASGMGGEVRDNIVIIDVYSDKSIGYRLIALNGNDINALGKLEDYEL